MCCVLDHYGYKHPDYESWTHLTWYSQDRVLQWLQALRAYIHSSAAKPHVTAYRELDSTVLPLARQSLHETRGTGSSLSDASSAHTTGASPSIPGAIPSPEFLLTSGRTISPVPSKPTHPLAAIGALVSSPSLQPPPAESTIPASTTQKPKAKRERKSSARKPKTGPKIVPLKIKLPKHPSSTSDTFTDALKNLASSHERSKLLTSSATSAKDTTAASPSRNVPSMGEISPTPLQIDEEFSSSETTTKSPPQPSTTLSTHQHSDSDSSAPALDIGDDRQ